MAIKEKITAYRFNKKRDLVFLLFVLGTFMFWFLNKLSKEYTQEVTYSVVYEKLPNQFIFQEEPLRHLSLRVVSDGFYFFSNAFRTNTLKISLENITKKEKYSYFLSNENLKKQVRSVIQDNVRVLDVVEDLIEVKLGKKSFKKLPVVSNVEIQYHAGYSSFSGIQLIPDSIEISGPEMQVSKISKIELPAFVKGNVKEVINEYIDIINPNVPKIVFDKKSVQIKVEVEKITEKSLMVPVQIINSPSDDIVVYPKKVKVTCQVRLSQFNMIQEKDFTVICDYNTRGIKHIKTELLAMPSVVSSVKLRTNKVEYLILK